MIPQNLLVSQKDLWALYDAARNGDDKSRFRLKWLKEHARMLQGHIFDTAFSKEDFNGHRTRGYFIHECRTNHIDYQERERMRAIFVTMSTTRRVDPDEENTLDALLSIYTKAYACLFEGPSLISQPILFEFALSDKTRSMLTDLGYLTIVKSTRSTIYAEFRIFH